jgi:hypothetical protein
MMEVQPFFLHIDIKGPIRRYLGKNAELLPDGIRGGRYVKKRTFKTLILSFVLTLICIVMIPSTSFACKCVEPLSVEAVLDQSKAVFVGKVMDIKGHKKNYYNLILFDVTKTWKGVSESEVLITASQSESECGFNFKEGEEYLVYANQYPSEYDEVEHYLSTGICDRTSELNEAEEDLLLLGTGHAPTKKVNLENELEAIGETSLVWTYGIGAGVVGIACLLFWKRFKQ